MNFILREVSLEQIAGIIGEADLRQVFLPHKDEPDFKVKNLFKYYENEKRYHIFELSDETNIAGFISVLPMDEEYSIAIGPMYISYKYQGLGLGKKQVIELIKWARNRQINKIYTKTWGRNNRSRRIFEELGFIQVSENPSQRIDGDSTVKYIYEIR